MRGTLSTLTAALVALLIISSLTSYFVLTYYRALETQRRSAFEYEQVISRMFKDIEVEVSDEGLVVRSPNPPIRVLGVLALYNQGGYKILTEGVTINTTSALILPRSTIDEVFSSGGKIVVLADGKYAILDPQNSRNSSGSGEVQEGNPGNYILPVSYDPYVIAGTLIDASSFISTPIPGVPGELGANYEPDVYVKLDGSPTGVVANRLKVTYSSDATCKLTFYNTYQGFMVLVPVLLSRDAVPELFVFDISLEPLAEPIRYGDLLSEFYVYCTYRPLIAAVTTLDYLRTPLVTKPAAVMLLGQFKNSVSRPLYWWYGGVRDVAAHWGASKCVASDSFALVLNPRDIFSTVPDTVSNIVALVGVMGYLKYSYTYGDARPEEYARLTLRILKLGDSTLTVSSDMLNKPVLIKVPYPQLVKPVVTDPDGAEVPLQWAGNVGSSEGGTYGFVWFNATREGEYSISITPGSSLNYPEGNITYIPPGSKWSYINYSTDGTTAEWSKEIYTTWVISEEDAEENIYELFTHEFTKVLDSSEVRCTSSYYGISANDEFRFFAWNAPISGNPGWVEVTDGWTSASTRFSKYIVVRCYDCGVIVSISTAYEPSSSKLQIITTFETTKYGIVEPCTVKLRRARSLTLQAVRVSQHLIKYIDDRGNVCFAVAEPSYELIK
ncbi:MAG: hypothetical protein J7L12_01480 [Desulfurococcales archaeon]|nr:hypothetical protein [Desulfurococcales archaeon]MCD6428270.1 hypothetical protein [Desulfurococcales archaeon]